MVLTEGTMSFRASVHYGDWKGTAAGDRSDSFGLHEYLERKKMMNDDEILIAASVWSGEDVGVRPFKVQVRAYLFRGVDCESVKAAIATTGGPIPVPRC
jgi:hypothetical protein